MQLNRLQLDLHPRPNAQALDLGFALLRANWRALYLTWLGLWLPLVGLCLLLAIAMPSIGAGSLVLAWWLRPLLERAPLYLLSRQVFGEQVHWLQALRAWPKQLGGGWFRLLTWWRLFVPSRGLYQPIWQLEGARGAAAAARWQVIGKHTASSAYWFGVVCANFELILQLGLFALIGLFVSDERGINPLIFFTELAKNKHSLLVDALTCLAYAFSVGIVAPIYVACSFTLYLNRRASLEAWDIEIVLRQMKVAQENLKLTTGSQKPAEKSAQSAQSTQSGRFDQLLGLALALVLLGALSATPESNAAASASSTQAGGSNPQAQCEQPQAVVSNGDLAFRSEDHSPEQKKIRADLATILSSDDLKEFICVQSWALKQKNDPKKNKPDQKTPTTNLDDLATLLKLALITALLVFIFWLLVRFQDRLQLPRFAKPRLTASVVAGLDIRPESLPAEVINAVHELWQAGQLRAALALLYRATLSRLVSQYDLHIHQGATEGDCLHLIESQYQYQTNHHNGAGGVALTADCLQVVRQTTNLWLKAAYGQRWPSSIDAICQQWQQVFSA